MEMTPAPELQEVLVTAERHVATITLNRPERRNALSAGLLQDLLAALGWASGEREVRVVVLTGAGQAFCAGADLSTFGADQPEFERHLEQHRFVEVFTLAQDLGKPLVGRINGVALAGGFGLACACDVLVASEDATFGTPEINVGVWPMMIQAILARNLPRKLVLEMMMLGGRYTAEQMRAAGLVNRVVQSATLDAAVDEIATQLAAKSPAVMRLGKDAFYRSQDMEFRGALEYLHTQLGLVSRTEDAREGVTAFFEKREPRFTGK